ncbi:unnamed protein product, partial [Mesorhabditis belari]|uniref:Uncharacterized protein n=1 Tax=Mesorhabditis belari TaxID=2138241 RepID=A0AAF3FPW5_9BILA
MILRWLLLVFFALHTEAAPKCENVLRSDVKKLYGKTFACVCPVDLRMATFKRTNGDRVPFLFSAEMCHSDGFSDMCDKAETCFTVEWLGFCCNDEAFLGDGPNAGVFNVTGLGGPVNHIRNAAHSEPPSGFGHPSGRGCVSQRIQCSLPKFTRPIRQDVFLMSKVAWISANEHILRTFDCAEEGFSAAVDINGTPLVYEKRLCGSPHDSDFCNRDEVCKTLKYDVGFCCQRSSEGAFKYAQMGRVGVETLNPGDSLDFILSQGFKK